MKVQTDKVMFKRRGFPFVNIAMNDYLFHEAMIGDRRPIFPL